MSRPHKHHVPKDLQGMTPLDRTNASLDRIMAEYKRRKPFYDLQGVSAFDQLVTFAKELEPEGALSIHGSSAMLVIAMGRLVEMELK